MKTSDIIGTALEDYLSGNSAASIIVHSDIAEDDILPVKYFFRDTAEMPAIERRALELCRGKVLDIGAAAGCHSLILQNGGTEVYPVDISPGAVRVMKKRGLYRARRRDFFRINNENYDTLLLLMNGIGICGRLEMLNVFFDKARRLLNPGGQILLDSSDIIYLFAGNESTFEFNLNAAYYGEAEYIMQYGQTRGKPFRWVFVDFDTLKKYAERHGFRCEKIMDGEHFDYLARLYFAKG